MSTFQLTAVILTGTAIIVSVATYGFVRFSRFMASEKEKTERFREMHGPDVD